MSRAVIRNGRWVREEGIPLDPCDLHQVHNQFNKIHEFAKDVELTHDKIEILSQILDASPEQERAILKILTMKDSALIKVM